MPCAVARLSAVGGPGDFLAGHDHGEALRALGPDDAVEPRQVEREDVAIEDNNAPNAYSA
jgi:hypothetical protein